MQTCQDAYRAYTAALAEIAAIPAHTLSGVAFKAGLLDDVECKGFEPDHPALRASLIHDLRALGEQAGLRPIVERVRG